MDTVTNPVAEAQAPAVFDVLAFVEGTAYPTKDVVIFQDAKSATDFVDAMNRRAAMPDEEVDSPEYIELSNEIETLSDKIKASSMIFSLRGMPPGIVAEIMRVPDGEEETLHSEERDNKLIAKTIVSVRNAAGAVDQRVWDESQVKKLRDFLKEGEFGKLVTAVGDINFNAMVFDQATDAGFPGRSANVA
jgi:hypothetical protein